MDTLREGSRGFKVRYLQRLLNKAAVRDRIGRAPLNEDGNLGSATSAAVRAFQSRHRLLVADGTVGHQTWTALGLRVEREHFQVIQFGQPTNTSCWSAAATEILGNQSVGPGHARLGANGGLEPSIGNLQVFANGLGWRMLNYSPGVPALVGLAQQTPLWIAASGANFNHAVVFSAVYSDGDAAGDGTMFRIHDPWPPGRGRIDATFSNPVSLLDSGGVSRVPTNNFFVLVPQ